MSDWRKDKDNRAYMLEIYFEYHPYFGEQLLDTLEAKIIDAYDGFCSIDSGATELMMTEGEEFQRITFYGDIDIEINCGEAHKLGKELIIAIIPMHLREYLGDWDVIPDPINPDE